MTEQRRWALLSVTDKTGLSDFAHQLVNYGYSLMSTGGTFKHLREHGLEVTEVSQYTGGAEIMDGRVKTLHPKIHAGILMDRANEAHLADAQSTGSDPIDMVVVNLYQFAKEAVAKKLTPTAAIEFIDVGGPTMLRAAAKNYAYCCPVPDPDAYQEIQNELAKDGAVSTATRQRLAARVFALTSRYDQVISEYLAGNDLSESGGTANSLDLKLPLITTLRYGENPHQSAALYATAPAGFATADILGGKELSYNNYLDLDAACQLAKDLGPRPVAVIIKHTNPCGAAVAQTTDETLARTFERAFACDPQSAFGGIVAINRPVDGATARLISEHFIECVAAPDFLPEAADILKSRKNLRIVRMADMAKPTEGKQLRSIAGALLVQSTDDVVTSPDLNNITTKTAPTPTQKDDLAFAMVVAKHVKSNAIVYARDLALLAVGAGQMSRIDSAKFAAQKAELSGRSLKGSVLASDAFFPFKDTVEHAASVGVAAIIQPGGSKRDAESVEACDEAGIAMVFTGTRHFRH